MNDTQKMSLLESISGKRTPEAVGDILREGLDFRIVEDDGKKYHSPPTPEDGMVHLTIAKGKITGACMN